MFKKLTLCTLVFLLFFIFITQKAYSYSGSTAKNYADSYATSFNPFWPYYSKDCTNFVSQCLLYGGYNMVGDYPDNSTTDNHYWFYNSYYEVPSHSWTVANDHINFQILHYPGGTYGNLYDGDIGNNHYNDALTGDVLAYDWDANGIKDHLSLEVGVGTDPNSGWHGDLVDQHSTNRYHAYWTLQPYNSQHYLTTTIRTVHISSSNN